MTILIEFQDKNTEDSVQDCKDKIKKQKQNSELKMNAKTKIEIEIKNFKSKNRLVDCVKTDWMIPLEYPSDSTG